MQQSADAGLLAAVRSKMLKPNLTDAEMTDIARTFYDANGAGTLHSAISNFQVVFDSARDTYVLTFSSDLDTILTRVAGQKPLARTSGRK